MGIIELEQKVENLEEIELVARAKLIDHQMSKKVYNASKDSNEPPTLSQRQQQQQQRRWHLTTARHAMHSLSCRQQRLFQRLTFYNRCIAHDTLWVNRIWCDSCTSMQTLVLAIYTR